MTPDDVAAGLDALRLALLDAVPGSVVSAFPERDGHRVTIDLMDFATSAFVPHDRLKAMTGAWPACARAAWVRHCHARRLGQAAKALPA
jgi:hypothetical protein